ncbi:MAG TPA: polyprenol monophosphomannose synthase [Dermatophilaceae bacterium]|jgi:dolichol-phosphate mannosyltransferase|nr:polyprenol monophosphomannose synthase [Actinomycetales bacterium]HMT31181.1 polyprenol monophosphomannose synthase [Dermatophilaceae bacterium]HMT91165.1 polyprenol monophosphomannose synthase [Dermatophilaceae bacterium]
MTRSERAPLDRVVVLIPTYNEKDNLPRIVGRVRASVPSADILVLDDNSPDGTGAVADGLAAADPQVHVLHRPGKQGLGAAYKAGFAWALERGYDAAVEMDADGSHQPEQLPALLEAARDADLVIGARWVRGGSVVNWPAHRKALSVGANIYTKLMLGLPVNDATGGYRVYRTSALRAMDLDSVSSAGYGFQVDMTVALVRAGLRAVEVPIEFVEREIGESKMSGNIVSEAFVNVGKAGVAHRVGQLRGLAAEVNRRRREGTWHSE